MKNKFLSSCSQGNYRDSLGDFSNASYGLFGAERVEGCILGYGVDFTSCERNSFSIF